MSATRPDPAALVRAHLEAESAQDLNGAMAVFSRDCWYAIPTRDLLLRGPAATRAHHAELLSSFPDLRNEVLELHVCATRVFAQLVVHRGHTRTWAGFPATGTQLRTHALAEFVVAQDGLLEAEIVHMNPLEALVQMSVCTSADVMSLVTPESQCGTG